MTNTQRRSATLVVRCWPSRRCCLLVLKLTLPFEGIYNSRKRFCRDQRFCPDCMHTARFSYCPNKKHFVQLSFADMVNEAENPSSADNYLIKMSLNTPCTVFLEHALFRQFVWGAASVRNGSQTFCYGNKQERISNVRHLKTPWSRW